MFKKILVSCMVALAVFCGVGSTGSSDCISVSEAASLKIYSGKGVGVVADTSSRWYTGDAGGVNVTFDRERCGTVNYSFFLESDGWYYTISDNAPDYASSDIIVEAVFRYVSTGETSIHIDS